jgi:hypothetical protein
VCGGYTSRELRGPPYERSLCGGEGEEREG